MRLQHLALFRGIGLGACAVNLGSKVPSTCIAPEQLWRLPSDRHTVTVEVAPDFPPSSSQRRSAAKSLCSFCALAKVRESMVAIMKPLSARCPDEVVVR